jgi:hypothetical protein
MYGKLPAGKAGKDLISHKLKVFVKTKEKKGFNPGKCVNLTKTLVITYITY